MNSHEEQYDERPLIREKKTQPKFIPLLLAGVLGSALTLGADYFIDSNQKTESVPDVVQNAAINDKDSASLSDMLENVSPAIVGVVNMQKTNGIFPSDLTNDEEAAGTGSGVIYQADDQSSYIVTNNHVVEGASDIKVQLSTGKRVNAELLGTDALTDIAVLKIKGDFNIKPLAFADSNKVRTGDSVYAIGNPLGLDLSNSVTKGIISAKERSMTVSTSAGESSVKAIQTDAAINPGNSGGALINTAGQLIGINSMKIAAAEVEGIGFAIPANDAQTVIAEIVKNGKVIRPYMGLALVSSDAIPPQYRSELNADQPGVVVIQTDEYAGKSVKKGDVIVAVDGKKVTSDSELKSYLYRNKKAGDTLNLTVVRDNKKIDVSLILRDDENMK
ncbi:trypsin-like serine protease [Macrococcus hajekii]|uniref:Serine protease HtrA-like n=1 Tax=Macrococcus hajekii TaxID=198482 RepID=A0A4R6BLL0_9STAP|nr:trypsin-like peptidase domain-containing protein [Macrococcus hajekii]TDM02679.1 trypsin-like serine protease [Macrococcus hajekii]GGB02998.1 serine protease [Macrococcus hajekii]